jgi:hypothetical protein
MIKSTLTILLFVLFIALLHEDHRDKLVKMFDCLTRKEIDGRNSVDKEDGLWEFVSNMYNNPSWVPRSHVFSELQFCQAMNLSLSSDADEMTADKAQTIMKNLCGKYKKAVSGWRASGNGKEGKAQEGEKIILLINGTTYNLEPTADDHDESTLIKYVDDDRLKFCAGDLSTAYFWGMVEEAGLTSFCMQNLGVFALENGRADSAKGRGGRKALTSKKDSIAQSIGAVPRQVQQIMNSFERTQQKLNDEKMILRCEEHLRQAVQLKYAWYVLVGSPYCWCSSLMTLIPSFNFSRHNSEDEHLRAKIEYSKMRRCKDPDLDLYLEDMNMKNSRVIDAESMIAKWESKIHELGEKDYSTSPLPNANMDDNGTLDEELADMTITDVLFSATGNDDVEEDDEDGEQDFGNAPSIDQINDVVDNIHREDD